MLHRLEVDLSNGLAFQFFFADTSIHHGRED